MPCCAKVITIPLSLFRAPPRRKQLEGVTHAPSQTLCWAQVPFEDQQGFAKLAAGYRIEWDGLVGQDVDVTKRELEGKKAVCQWNARVGLFPPTTADVG